MELLPTRARRTFIVRALDTLRQQRDDDAVVKWPIREPGDRDFPDRWEPTVEGARRLANRILKHAQLGWLTATMEGYREPGNEPSSGFGAFHHRGTAAWYAGFDEVKSLCFFGVDLAGLREANAIVGTMCHEIAHAYRDVHGLVVDDREVEEQLTDLTTVFLGFGVLSANASYVYRSGGIAGASMKGHQWSHESRGYLAVEEFTYALAYQVGLRGGRDAAKVAELLDPTQRDCFEAALEELGVREPSRKMSPGRGLVVRMLLLLLVPAVGWAALVTWRSWPGGGCADDYDCPRDAPSCVSRICVQTCTSDASCDEGQRCRAVHDRLRVCVSH